LATLGGDGRNIKDPICIVQPKRELKVKLYNEECQAAKGKQALGKPEISLLFI
jgi:hypothetical protein